MNAQSGLRYRPAWILALFLMLASFRDVGTELFLKRWGIVPIDVLLLAYCLSGLLLALILRFGVPSEGYAKQKAFENQRSIVSVAVLTVVGFALTLVAMKSELGAAYNSFIDYGITPAFTAMVAGFWLKEQMNIRYTVGLIAALAGAACFATGSSSNGVTEIRVGVVFSLGAALCSAMVHPLNKRLLTAGLPAQFLLAVRLLPLGSLMLIIVLFEGHISYFRSQPFLLPFALLFFAVPIYLVLIVLKRIQIHRLAAWLFLLPCCTYAVSLVAGLKTGNPYGFCGIALTAVGYAVMEWER